ncbi:hypothetical protein PCIT_b0309 [Pseudoalteromonas citrea]|uniref:Lipoprotein n=2 Tax=Pseudoalteromonas citrea TaxID=43655 RepID=A0AAD4AE89_9GAMM|nr:hypothetical protein [Pseudoalteromonas citrea]KAF7764336.1 hypothetical protein PCIT_b0309 [Pseudoalteromonas citrea]
MENRFITVIALMVFLSGCAQRTLNISDEKGVVVGECVAGFDWHFYGLDDSIDYMLYECAKNALAKGFTIDEPRLLTLDFSLPQLPKGLSWNKKRAMAQFHEGNITERKLGYILASIENDYTKVAWAIEDDLASGNITEQQYKVIIEQAKRVWLGE